MLPGFFFHSKVEENSLKQKEKYSDKVKNQRKGNRVERVSIEHIIILRKIYGRIEYFQGLIDRQRWERACNYVYALCSHQNSNGRAGYAINSL